MSTRIFSRGRRQYNYNKIIILFCSPVTTHACLAVYKLILAPPTATLQRYKAKQSKLK
jgi:hypothetical protein